MICLRCGYCCHKLSVMIINDPRIGVSEGNIIFHEGNGERCKHLIGNRIGDFSCVLHEYMWYQETPCYQYSQIEQKNSYCRIGKAILKGEIKY